MGVMGHPPPPPPSNPSGTGMSLATTLNSSVTPQQKTPEREHNVTPVAELQPELMRVEADRNAEIMELEGHVGGNDTPDQEWARTPIRFYEPNLKS